MIVDGDGVGDDTGTGTGWFRPAKIMFVSFEVMTPSKQERKVSNAHRLMNSQKRRKSISNLAGQLVLLQHCSQAALSLDFSEPTYRISIQNAIFFDVPYLVRAQQTPIATDVHTRHSRPLHKNENMFI